MFTIMKQWSSSSGSIKMYKQEARRSITNDVEETAEQKGLFSFCRGLPTYSNKSGWTQEMDRKLTVCLIISTYNVLLSHYLNWGITTVITLFSIFISCEDLILIKPKWLKLKQPSNLQVWLTRGNDAHWRLSFG